MGAGGSPICTHNGQTDPQANGGRTGGGQPADYASQFRLHVSPNQQVELASCTDRRFGR